MKIIRWFVVCLIFPVNVLADSTNPPDIFEQLKRIREAQMQKAPATDVDVPVVRENLPEPEKPAEESAKEEAPTILSMEPVSEPVVEKDDKPKIKIGGRIMFDVRHHEKTDPNEEATSPSTVFGIRRARLDVRGKMAPSIKFKTSIDMTDKVKVKDVYIKVKQSKQITYEGGQFNYPLGSENIGSSRYYEFVEPSMLSDTFSGGRDRGILVLGNAFDEHLFFSAGVLNGSGTATPDRNSSMDIAGQAQALLFENKDLKASVWLGGSYETGKRDSTEGESIEVKPESESGHALFAVDMPNDTPYNRQRFDVDAKILYGPAMLAGEYLQGDYTYENQARVSGGYVFASYFITGEQRTVEEGMLEKQKIHNPFGKGDGLGAWEVAVRYSWFQISDAFFLNDALFASWEGLDPATSARNGKAITVAINWYPTKRTRVMMNYVQTTTQLYNAEQAAYSNLFSENAILIRGQIEY